MVFLQKKNITKWEHIKTAAEWSGLNAEQLKADIDGKAKALFEQDLKAVKVYGVRGFPTMFFLDDLGNKEIVYGSKPYAAYEAAILKLHPTAAKSEYSKDWESLFAKYLSLTAREFSELSGTQREESETKLNELVVAGNVEKLVTKNGGIWTIK